jgi:hypothetical protein
MSTRRLEMSVEKMKAKTTTQLAELSKKTDAINQLKRELGEKTAAIFALEARDKTLRDQLRASEEEFQIKSGGCVKPNGSSPTRSPSSPSFWANSAKGRSLPTTSALKSLPSAPRSKP